MSGVGGYPTIDALAADIPAAMAAYDADVANERERMVLALTLRKEGRSPKEIQRSLGMSHRGGLHQLYSRLLARVVRGLRIQGKGID